MKNRKLFAIITLVAFMLTMMPMMAFATTASGSSISVEDGSAKADGVDGLEFIIDVDGELADGTAADAIVDEISGKVDKATAEYRTARTAAEVYYTIEGDSTVEMEFTVKEEPESSKAKEAKEALLAAQKKLNDLRKDLEAAQKEADALNDSKQFIIVFAERNGALSDVDYIKTTEPDDDNQATEDAGFLIIDGSKGSVSGEDSLYVYSKTPGTVTLKAYVISGYTLTPTDITSDIAKLYNGNSEFLKTGFIGNGVTGKFNATSSTIEAKITIDEETGENGIVDANNGVDYYDVTVAFTKGGAKLVGEDVTLSIDKNGGLLNKEEVTTSATGKIDFKVSASKPGTYTVTIECGTYSEELEFTFGAANISKVEFSYTVDGTIAVGVEETVAMQVRAYDANGNVLAPSVDVAKQINGAFKFEVTNAPEDSALEDSELPNVAGFDGPVVFKPATSDNMYISFEPDAVGSYTIKGYHNTTGVADTTTIQADEFGVIDHATISYPAATYSLGANTPGATVYLYDQNGVKKSVKTNKKFSYTGLGIADFDATNGQITFKDDSAYSGNEIVVSVVANGKYAASTTLTIGAAPATLEFTTVNGEVGEEVTVNAQVVDVNGNPTAVSAASGYYTVGEVVAVVTERPAGANVSVDADYFEDFSETFLKKGTGKVVITSNKEGTVRANVVVELIPTTAAKAINEDLTTIYLTGIATVGFGEGAVDATGADDVVTFIIGTNTFIANDKAISSDVAPYIVDGRTFIPVRAFVEATGATVEYDAVTQVVTIAGDGIDAQMTIGSNILTVNGETVVMDTAAAIKDGRTVLPVRYAGQAIGYDFECAYGANGAVTAVTMFK